MSNRVERRSRDLLGDGADVDAVGTLTSQATSRPRTASGRAVERPATNELHRIVLVVLFALFLVLLVFPVIIVRVADRRLCEHEVDRHRSRRDQNREDGEPLM